MLVRSLCCGMLVIAMLLVTGAAQAADPVVPSTAPAAAPVAPAPPAAPAAPAPKPSEKHYEMAVVQFVVLKAVPGGAPLAPAEAEALQGRHLAFLQDLADRGVALAVGPLGDAGDLKGVAVLDVKTPEEAQALFAEDAWIKSGRLVAEVKPWYTAKGIFQRRSGAFTDVEPWLLGLLVRPENAPSYSPEKLKEIQAGHMANIGTMADAGVLVIAGPMAVDGSLRGLFVFRDGDRAMVEAMAAKDPAFIAGRLTMTLHRWWLPKGTLPPR